MSADDLVTLGARLWVRKCRGERIDALERLPYFRSLFIRQRRAGAELAFTEYGHLLARAMKPVQLPKDRVRAADPEQLAARYHDAAMQQFYDALGIAA